MKPRRLSAIAALAVVVIALSAASCPADRATYNSIDGAVTAVQDAMKAWNATQYQPKVGADPATWNGRRDKVLAAYAKFQATAQLATTLAQDITQKQNAAKVASDAAGEVIALINSFSP